MSDKLSTHCQVCHQSFYVNHICSGPSQYVCSTCYGGYVTTTSSSTKLSDDWIDSFRYFAANDYIVDYQPKNKPTVMKKLSTMFKKLTDPSVQTLSKAQFINGDLELTQEGKDALLSIVFDANKAALVALAQEKIDEESKESKK